MYIAQAFIQLSCAIERDLYTHFFRALSIICCTRESEIELRMQIM